MNRKLIQTLAVAAGVFVGVCAMAQEPAGPPQGGPQGGFQGGPQGGPQGGRMGGPPPMMGRRPMGGPAILLRPEVREELKLSDDQVKKIESAFHLQARGPRGDHSRGDQPPMGGPGPDGPGGPNGEGGPGMPPPPGEEGGPGMPPPPDGGFGGRQGGPGMGRPDGPDNAGRVAEADKKLKGILNGEQFARYHEISLQMAGPDAITRPDVAKQLGLSEEQVSKIHAILEKNRPMGGPAGGPNGGREGRPPRPPQDGGDENGRPPMPPQGEGFGPGGPEGPDGPVRGGPGGPGGPNREERKKIDAQVLAVLTDAQKSQWKTMLGKPFEPRRPEGRPPQD